MRQWQLAAILTVTLAVAARVLGAVLAWGASDPDALAFLTQARTLMQGDVWAWFAIHNKPPFYSLLIAAGGLMGLSLTSAAKLVSLMAGIAVLHPAWLILRRMGDRTTALLALAVVAFMREGIQLSSRDIADTVNALLMLYAMYFLLVSGMMDRRSWAFALAGLIVGVNFLTRTEALMYLPFGLTMIAPAALTRRLTFAEAIKAATLFAAGVILLTGIYVAAVSHEEGRLTLRRNMGHLMLYEVGLRNQPLAGQLDEPTNELAALTEGSWRLARQWVHALAGYIYWGLPEYGVFLPAIFLPIGLIADRRHLRQWGLWQLGLLMLIMGMMGLSIIGPHPRFLAGLIWLAGWPIARGIIVTSQWLIRVNPLRLKRTNWVRTAMPLGCLAFTLTAATIDWTWMNVGEGGQLVTAAKVISADWQSSAPPRIAGYEAMVVWHANGEWHDLDAIDRRFDLDYLQDFLHRGKADYLAVTQSKLLADCAEFNVAPPPDFLEPVADFTYNDRRWRQQRFLIYRIVKPPPPMG